MQCIAVQDNLETSRENLIGKIVSFVSYQIVLWLESRMFFFSKMQPAAFYREMPLYNFIEVYKCFSLNYVLLTFCSDDHE